MRLFFSATRTRMTAAASKKIPLNFIFARPGDFDGALDPMTQRHGFSV